MQIVGLISGTSVDGIDAALVEVDGHGYEISVNLLAALTHPYPPDLRQKILNLCAGQPTRHP
jgi:anhydro-N-acetylmuramic acid kinase